MNGKYWRQRLSGLLICAALTSSVVSEPVKVMAAGGTEQAKEAGPTGQEATEGWIRDETGRWRHLRNGRADRDWYQDEDGGWYYLASPDGWMLAGQWYQDLSGFWYRLNTDGRMLAGQWFQDLDGLWYYLSPDGTMMKNAVTPDGYTLLDSGAWDPAVPRIAEAAVGAAAATAAVRHSGGGSGGGSGGSSSGGGGSSSGGGSNSGGSSSGSSGNSSGNSSGTGDSGSGTGTGDSSSGNLPDSLPDSLPNLSPDSDTGTDLWPDTGQSQKPDPDTGQPQKPNPETGTDASPSDAEMVYWQVRFTDRETHQTILAPTRSGWAEDGSVITVNFRSRITDQKNQIWETQQKVPWEITVYGPGNRLYYIEYDQVATVPEPELPDAKARETLERWYEEARAAEALLTGEEAWTIPGERFLAEHQQANDRRFLTAAGEILEKDGDYTVCVIGKNWKPNGMIIGMMFREKLDYSHETAGEVMIGTDCYTFSRFHVRPIISEEYCRHEFVKEERSPAACLKNGKAVYVCDRCGMEEPVILPAIGHADLDGNGICDRCKSTELNTQPEPVHWNLGDVQARELDGEVRLFRCIDQNYGDTMEDHRQQALFLCDSVIPADHGSDWRLEEQVDGSYDYRFIAGPIVHFGETSDYKYSKIRTWLDRAGEKFFNTNPVNIGVSAACLGSTEPGTWSDLSDSKLRLSFIGSQKMTGKLFALSVEEALLYREYLWKFDGSDVENPETQTGMFSKGYWLRTPEGTAANYNTGNAYCVDLVNGNLHPVEVRPDPEIFGDDEELAVTGTIGVRPAFTMPQE